MTAEAIHNQKVATENMSRICELLGLEPFRWFMRQCVLAKMDELDRDLKDLRKTPDERTCALYGWHALNHVKTWPETFRATAGKTLGHEPKLPIDFHEQNHNPQ